MKLPFFGRKRNLGVWEKGINAEIAQSWHNLNRVKPPEDWFTPVNGDRTHAKTCQVAGPPEKMSVEGNSWTRTTINWKGEFIEAGCRIDLHDTRLQLPACRISLNWR